jgi:hypothetical protein
MLKCEKTARVILITHSGYITYFIDFKDGTEITIDAVKELSKLGPCMCLEQRSEHTGQYY